MFWPGLSPLEPEEVTHMRKDDSSWGTFSDDTGWGTATKDISWGY